MVKVKKRSGGRGRLLRQDGKQLDIPHTHAQPGPRRDVGRRKRSWNDVPSFSLLLTVPVLLATLARSQSEARRLLCKETQCAPLALHSNPSSSDAANPIFFNGMSRQERGHSITWHCMASHLARALFLHPDSDLQYTCIRERERESNRGMAAAINVPYSPTHALRCRRSVGMTRTALQMTYR